MRERIKKFIKYLGISEREFCRVIGVSESYVTSMRRSMQPDKLQNIALHYPDLNIEWLVTGEGEMLKKMPLEYLSKTKIPKTEEPEVKIYSCQECIEKQKKIDELTEKCELQRKLIYEYELQLEKRRKVDCG